MKKVIAWLLVLALTAAISIGATLAYLTDTDEDVNVMTLGKVRIDQLEYERVDNETKNEDAAVQEFHDDKPLIPAVTEDRFTYTPGDTYVDWEQIGKDGYTSDIWNPDLINNEVDKMVFVKNKGDYDAYVRSVFAFEAGKYTTLDEFKQMVHLNLNNDEDMVTWEWIETPVAIPNEEGTTTNYFIAVATYKDPLAPGAVSEISLSQIALDSSATNEDVEAFGDTFQVLVKTQAIQADGFTDAATALNEGFGEITADSIPWETDAAPKGVDLRTALHYLNGDGTTQITNKVTNVIYGLNKDYTNIVDSYDGTLITEEQDVNVYSYYVPNGDNYDVYVLANDTVYSPKDSSKLYYKMSALKKVDTSNYDVSRTEDMSFMFRTCTALTDLDVSRWDTSNVTTMATMFTRCTALPALDVSGWDVSNVTSMEAMFYGTISMENLVGLGNWNTASLEICNSMFSSINSNSGEMPYTKLEVENWDMSNVTNPSFMFYGCGNLTELDLSKWDMSKATTFNHMFTDCYALKSINLDGWDTSNVSVFQGMFNNCDSLEYVDVSSFDTQNVIDFGQMFEYCKSLKEIKGLENFDTRNADTFYEMFSGCSSLTELDLSSFDTPKLTCTFRNFNNCIYVSDGWDMSKVTYSDQMFSGCSNLVGGNGTTFQGSDIKYACVDTEETPGYLTYKAAQITENP